MNVKSLKEASLKLRIQLAIHRPIHEAISKLEKMLEPLLVLAESK